MLYGLTATPGPRTPSVVVGWVFASHYHWAWVAAAALCFTAVAITVSIPRRAADDVVEVEQPVSRRG